MPPKRKRQLHIVEYSSDAGHAHDSEENDENSSSTSASDEQDGPSIPTPSKRPRGRPPKKTTSKAKAKAKAKTRDESPPRALPAQERFFFDNRPRAAKTSSNTLSSGALLSHEDYYELMRTYRDPHRHDIEFLHEVYAQSFEQWWLELNQGFSVCLHGWGSKRDVLKEFGEFVVGEVEDAQKVVVINGYAAGVGIRDVLSVLASTIPEIADSLPGQPLDAYQAIASELPPKGPPTRLLLINSIDHANLRKAATQTLLSKLAAHPSIGIIASCDTPNFQLLWDVRMRTHFNWVFHDATTFLSFSDSEVPAVDAVNSLLGRSSRKVQGRDGVLFVLRSLTESARRLFALILAEVLEAGEEGAGVGTIEYKSLQRKAVENLISASEMQFRQLLKEFFDHEMLSNERDNIGTEYLKVPFRREECESILDELAVES